MIVCDQPQRVGPWVCERAGGSWVNGRGSAIGLEHAGELIAGVLYEDWNGAHVVCHIAATGNWASRQYLGTIFDYPFNQLGVNRITVPVESANQACIRMVRHMGFEQEATLLRAGRTGDLLLFRLFKNDCRYLKGKYALSPSRHQ